MKEWIECSRFKTFCFLMLTTLILVGIYVYWTPNMRTYGPELVSFVGRLMPNQQLTRDDIPTQEKDQEHLRLFSTPSPHETNVSIRDNVSPLNKEASKTSLAGNNPAVLNKTGGAGNLTQSDKYPEKKILFWTKFWNMLETAWLGMFQRFPNSTCAVDKCKLVFDKKEVNSADAVVFHLPDFEANNLPAYRRPDQLYIAFTVEGPQLLSRSKLENARNVFNLTMTYRRDSDIFTPYGVTLPQPEPLPVKDYWEMKNKSRVVSWLVSNCKTPGRRRLFVSSMKKHIPVDIHGKCNKRLCGPRQGVVKFDQCSFVYHDYMFYLAFENQICRDYVTEKFFNPMRSSAVPVVFGGATYSLFGPPNSYIDALAFPGPKELAHYLKEVAANRTLYNSYHQWRQMYRVSPAIAHSSRFCELCAFLHNRTDAIVFRPDPLATPKGVVGRVNGFYPDLAGWFLRGSNCHPWTPPGTDKVR